jgi:hypothetical protein
MLFLDLQPLSVSFLFVSIRDNSLNRTLKTAATTDVTNMTIEACISFCTPTGYTFIGLEFGRVSCCFSTRQAVDYSDLTHYSTGML